MLPVINPLVEFKWPSNINCILPASTADTVGELNLETGSCITLNSSIWLDFLLEAANDRAMDMGANRYRIIHSENGVISTEVSLDGQIELDTDWVGFELTPQGIDSFMAFVRENTDEFEYPHNFPYFRDENFTEMTTVCNENPFGPLRYRMIYTLTESRNDEYYYPKSGDVFGIKADGSKTLLIW